MKNSGEKGTGRSGTYCNKELQYDGGREVAGEDAALRTGVEDVDAATPSSITQVAQSLTDCIFLLRRQDKIGHRCRLQ